MGRKNNSKIFNAKTDRIANTETSREAKARGMARRSQVTTDDSRHHNKDGVR